MRPETELTHNQNYQSYEAGRRDGYKEGREFERAWLLRQAKSEALRLENQADTFTRNAYRNPDLGSRACDLRMRADALRGFVRSIENSEDVSPPSTNEST